MKPTTSRAIVVALFGAVLFSLGAGRSGAAAPTQRPATAPAAEEGASAPVRVRAVAQRPWVTPDAEVLIAVVLEHEEHYHTWPAAPEAGDQDPLPPEVAEFAIRTAVGLTSQPDWVAGVGPTQYPVPVPAKVADPSGMSKTTTVPCYQGIAVAYIPLVVKADAVPGPRSLSISVGYQACNESMCTAPEDLTLEVPLEVVTLERAATMPKAGGADSDLFKGFDIQRMADLRAGKVALPAAAPGASQAVRFDVFGFKFSIDPRGLGLVLLLLAAFVGGFILNFTPCVLPVIPLKIMGLANSAGNPARCFYLGSIMSAGVVAFWLILGVLILTISGFTAISSLFAYPLVILGIGVFILLMGLGMLGLFTVSLPQGVYLLNPKQETATGSFMFGILTAVLATPCTAPFMGTAAAWAAATKNPAMVLGVFGAIGLGMAVPYFILAANPKLVRKMPSAGPASDLVKQVMGGLMMAVAVFFLGNAMLGLWPTVKIIAAIMWWAIAVFAAGTAVWMLVRAFRITPAPLRRVAVALVALVLVAVPTALAVNMTRPDPIPWRDYDAAVLASELQSGNVAVLDFTAEWCLNCKALEHAVLHQEAVVKALNQSGVVPIKVDVTAKSAPGWAKLKEYQEVGIPLLVVVRPGSGEVVFKSNAYTPQQVVKAIEQAKSSGGVP